MMYWNLSYYVVNCSQERIRSCCSSCCYQKWHIFLKSCLCVFNSTYFLNTVQNVTPNFLICCFVHTGDKKHRLLDFAVISFSLTSQVCKSLNIAPLTDAKQLHCVCVFNIRLWMCLLECTVLKPVRLPFRCEMKTLYRVI